MSYKKKCMKPGTCVSGGIVGGAHSIDAMSFPKMGHSSQHMGGMGQFPAAPVKMNKRMRY